MSNIEIGGELPKGTFLVNLRELGNHKDPIRTEAARHNRIVKSVNAEAVGKLLRGDGSSENDQVVEIMRRNERAYQSKHPRFKPSIKG